MPKNPNVDPLGSQNDFSKPKTFKIRRGTLYQTTFFLWSRLPSTELTGTTRTSQITVPWSLKKKSKYGLRFSQKRRQKKQMQKKFCKRAIFIKIVCLPKKSFYSELFLFERQKNLTFKIRDTQKL